MKPCQSVRADMNGRMASVYAYPEYIFWGCSREESSPCSGRYRERHLRRVSFYDCPLILRFSDPNSSLEQFEMLDTPALKPTTPPRKWTSCKMTVLETVGREAWGTTRRLVFNSSCDPDASDGLWCFDYCQLPPYTFFRAVY